MRVLVEGGAGRRNIYWSSTAQMGTDTPGEGQEVTQPGLQDIGRGRCLVSFNPLFLPPGPSWHLVMGTGGILIEERGMGEGRGLPEEGGQSHGPCSYPVAPGQKIETKQNPQGTPDPLNQNRVGEIQALPLCEAPLLLLMSSDI